LICVARFRQGLRAAIAKAADLGFEVVSDEKISRTYFNFEFETVSRNAASRMKKLIASAPAGVRVSVYESVETVDKDARGVELYAPVHDYKFCGKGRTEGAFEALLSFRTALANNEFFEVGDILVEF
jgi:hypothetical protein